MNDWQNMEDGTGSGENSPQSSVTDSQHPEVSTIASVEGTNNRRTKLAVLPIITDCSWEKFHETRDLTLDSLNEEMDNRNRLYFRCPQCDRRGQTKLAGVRNYITDWTPIGQRRSKCWMTINVFEVQCPSCRVYRNFKICCDQLPESHTGSSHPLTRSYSGVPRATGSSAKTPVIHERYDDSKHAMFRSYVRIESGTDYLCFLCTQQSGWGRYGGVQLVGAVTDPETPRIRGSLFSVTAFRFQLCCEPECSCATYFDIPVTGQELEIR